MNNLERNVNTLSESESICNSIWHGHVELSCTAFRGQFEIVTGEVWHNTQRGVFTIYLSSWLPGEPGWDNCSCHYILRTLQPSLTSTRSIPWLLRVIQRIEEHPGSYNYRCLNPYFCCLTQPINFYYGHWKFILWWFGLFSISLILDRTFNRMTLYINFRSLGHFTLQDFLQIHCSFFDLLRLSLNYKASKSILISESTIQKMKRATSKW